MAVRSFLWPAVLFPNFYIYWKISSPEDGALEAPPNRRCLRVVFDAQLRRALVGTLAGPRKKFQFEGSPKNMSEKTQKFQTNKHTMWIGNVRNLSFQDQLRATIAVDLDELSMTPLDFDRNLAKGLSARDMRMMAADAGVSLPILDPMASWAPHWRSGISDAAWMEFLGYSADDFFRIAEQLGVSTMTVIGTFQPGLVAITGNRGKLRSALADKARSHGLHCVLEFIPLWGIGDLASAWQKSFRSRTVRTPALRSTFGTTSGAGGTTRSCDRFREARSPMFR